MCPGHIKVWKSPVVKQLLLAWPRRFWGPLDLHEEAGGGLGAEAQDDRASSWPQHRGVLLWPPTEQVGLFLEASAQCFLWLMAGLSVGGSLPASFADKALGEQIGCEAVLSQAVLYERGNVVQFWVTAAWKGKGIEKIGVRVAQASVHLQMCGVGRWPLPVPPGAGFMVLSMGLWKEQLKTAAPSTVVCPAKSSPSACKGLGSCQSWAQGGCSFALVSFPFRSSTSCWRLCQCHERSWDEWGWLTSVLVKFNNCSIETELQVVPKEREADWYFL